MCTWHHLYRRRNRNDWVWLCFKCHDWVHMNPKDAEKEGLYLENDGVIRRKPRKKAKPIERKRTSAKYI